MQIVGFPPMTTPRRFDMRPGILDMADSPVPPFKRQHFGPALPSISMNIDRASAERICKLIQDASTSCLDSLQVIKEHENLGAIQVYGRLVGRFLGDSCTNLLVPIWEAYPDLEPQEMKQPFVPPEATLTAESRAAIEAFVSTAAAAMRETGEILAAQQLPAMLPYGGFEEVEAAVTKVSDFLAKPRFSDEDSGEAEGE